ncbi:outer membrane protein [Sphingomonas metalli]|uniref:Outer membrane protein n=1 Tax=Sphingomonas metalli TaxID=1779358 RepID=A0A916WNS7_9SPHN|nr:DsbA family protein [Sphingomonas metalli]GGB20129.1 outer membrane protein [Sphingomonas metalli]
MTNWKIPALAALAGGLIGSGGTVAWQQAHGDAFAVAHVVAHPDLLSQAIDRYQQGEAKGTVAANRAAILTPFAGAVAGNPQGDVTLVEYYDYNCGYCRASLPMIRQLIAADPRLKVVFRELPILAESSRAAARMSLLAATQGKFNAFHDTLYAGGRVTDETIAAAARSAGVDTSKLAAATPRIDAEIRSNLETAAKLGVNGTPSWVVGDRMLAGALPIEELQRAIAEARPS